MKKTSSRQIGGIMAAVLMLGIAGQTLAQSTNIQMSGAVAPETESSSGMPPIRHQGNISYVSGGIGSGESAAMKAAQRHWPLAMLFIGPSSEYLADVPVSIVNAQGNEVLKTEARGPYMLVKLPPGQYTVKASYNGHPQTKTIKIPNQGGARADFRWETQ